MIQHPHDYVTSIWHKHVVEVCASEDGEALYGGHGGGRARRRVDGGDVGPARA